MSLAPVDNSLYLREVALRRDKIPDFRRYRLNLPAVTGERPARCRLVRLNIPTPLLPLVVRSAIFHA